MAAVDQIQSDRPEICRSLHGIILATINFAPDPFRRLRRTLISLIRKQYLHQSLHIIPLELQLEHSLRELKVCARILVFSNTVSFSACRFMNALHLMNTKTAQDQWKDLLKCYQIKIYLILLK